MKRRKEEVGRSGMKEGKKKTARLGTAQEGCYLFHPPSFSLRTTEKDETGVELLCGPVSVCNM